jgi:hypothetical protein
MDSSERWRIACQMFAYAALFAISGVGFYLAFKARVRWIPGLLLACSSLLLIGTGLALWLDMALFSPSRMRGPAIPSPDGSHVVVVYWDLSGAIGFDHVNVLIRRKYSPFAVEVFRGISQSPPSDPIVLWTDDHHLLVSYQDRGKTSKCEPQANQVAGIDVLCRE